MSADSGPVAVLGATGLVGRDAVTMLRQLGVARLRVGARDRDRLAALAAQAGAEPLPVDADRPESLARFCAGARLVLNCAGPSYLLLDRVGRAAFAADADYVDVSGDGPAYQLLAGAGLPPAGRVAVLSAGMLPGLANLVPLMLGEGELAGADLLVYAGGIERFSDAAAGDLVLSLDASDEAGNGAQWYGEPFAAWRAGRRVSRALAVAEQVRLAPFPGRVTLMPFLTADGERLARATGLDSLRWFNVFTGGQLRLVLGRWRGQVSQDPATLAAAVAELATAAEVDRAGQQPYYLMTFTLTRPDRGGQAAARTAVLRTHSSFALTAATAALTTRAVLGGQVPAGLHVADEVLDPQATLAGVRDLGALPELRLHDHPPGGWTEEGTL